jgi:hypothetical protein
MSATLSRLILSMTLIAATPLVYVLGVWIAFVGEVREQLVAFLIATFFAMGFLTGGWVLVWRGELQWTSTRRRRTWGLLGAGAGVAAISCGIGYLAFPFEGGALGLMIGTMLWALGWLGGTAWVWRENAAERAERLKNLGVGTIACPRCGYNLTGLREARCPECGSQYTIDQLYGAMLEQRRETPQQV